IALPLLALAVTGSAASSGLVLAAAAVARLAAGLPAGALVDRYNRKAIMIGCAVAQTIAAGSLAAAVWTGTLTLAHLVVAAVVMTASRGVPAGQIGVMAAMLGAGGVVGALLAPPLSKRLSAYAAIVSVFWVVALLTPVATMIHNGYLMGLLFFVMALPAPT